MASDTAPHGVSRFLTVADVAQLLDVDVAEVMDLVTSAQLPAVRVGAQWRVERDQLEAFIEAMYEEQRRHALWLGIDYGNIPELSGSTVIAPPPRGE